MGAFFGHMYGSNLTIFPQNPFHVEPSEAEVFDVSWGKCEYGCLIGESPGARRPRTKTPQVIKYLAQ